PRRRTPTVDLAGDEPHLPRRPGLQPELGAGQHRAHQRLRRAQRQLRGLADLRVGHAGQPLRCQVPRQRLRDLRRQALQQLLDPVQSRVSVVLPHLRGRLALLAGRQLGRLRRQLLRQLVHRSTSPGTRSTRARNRAYSSGWSSARRWRSSVMTGTWYSSARSGWAVANRLEAKEPFALRVNSGWLPSSPTTTSPSPAKCRSRLVTARSSASTFFFSAVNSR